MTFAPFDLDRVGGFRGMDALITEVLAAGEDALKLYREGAANRARVKPDRSPVTEADEAVEKRLRAYFAKAHPTADFLGEETGEQDTKSDLRFIVDPIDGTRAFVRGLKTWSILVGLEADGTPAIGIAYFPADNDLYVAARGHGAHGNGRPLKVSNVRALADSMITHGALAQFTDANLEYVLPKLARGTYTQRGLADFDGYRQVLLGTVDAMIDPSVKPWDLSPAAVLIPEAGGRFSALDGTETIYGGVGVATNGHIHDELLTLIRG